MKFDILDKRSSGGHTCAGCSAREYGTVGERRGREGEKGEEKKEEEPTSAGFFPALPDFLRHVDTYLGRGRSGRKKEERREGRSSRRNRR